jgi:hypothetical protein
MMSETNKPIQQNCRLCVHYYITHDVNFMYGCRMFGIKSQRQPLMEIIEASGKPCEGFELKQRPPASGS